MRTKSFCAWLIAGAATLAACSSATTEAPSNPPAVVEAGGAADASVTTDGSQAVGDGGTTDGDAVSGTCAIAPTSTTIATTTMGAACTPADLSLDTLTYTTTPVEIALDLFRPKSITRPLALVIWIHGGGWATGTRANAEQARWLACNGYAVASIDYRLSAEAQFPAQIHDVKAAIRFLRANAARYQLDANRFVAFGSSAGGHLAALAGVSGGAVALEDPAQGHATTSSRVQAAIAWYPPTDFAAMDADIAASSACAAPGRHGEASSAESKVLGCTVADASCAAAVAAANPMTYVDATDPPFLIMQGTDDCNVAPGQSARLRDALNATTKCAAHRLVAAAGHGGPEWQTAEARAEVSAFLAKVVP